MQAQGHVLDDSRSDKLGSASHIDTEKESHFAGPTSLREASGSFRVRPQCRSLIESDPEVSNIGAGMALK